MTITLIFYILKAFRNINYTDCTDQLLEKKQCLLYNEHSKDSNNNCLKDNSNKCKTFPKSHQQKKIYVSKDVNHQSENL